MAKARLLKTGSNRRQNTILCRLFLFLKRAENCSCSQAGLISTLNALFISSPFVPWQTATSQAQTHDKGWVSLPESRIWSLWRGDQPQLTGSRYSPRSALRGSRYRRSLREVKTWNASSGGRTPFGSWKIDSLGGNNTMACSRMLLKTFRSID